MHVVRSNALYSKDLILQNGKQYFSLEVTGYKDGTADNNNTLKKLKMAKNKLENFYETVAFNKNMLFSLVNVVEVIDIDLI